MKSLDPDLIALFRAGNTAAFDTIYGQYAGRVIVQTADERQVEWRTRVSRMRSKPVSTKADLQNIIALKDFPPDSLTRDLGFWSLPPEAADLLLVPTVVRCPLAQGSFTAMRGFFYLRRERDGFKVIRWDFGW